MELFSESKTIKYKIDRQLIINLIFLKYKIIAKQDSSITKNSTTTIFSLLIVDESANFEQ